MRKTMDFALTPKMLEMQSNLQVFIDRHILPANVEWHREVEAGRYPMPLLDRLKDRAKAEEPGTCSCQDCVTTRPVRG